MHFCRTFGALGSLQSTRTNFPGAQKNLPGRRFVKLRPGARRYLRPASDTKSSHKKCSRVSERRSRFRRFFTSE